MAVSWGEDWIQTYWAKALLQREPQPQIYRLYPSPAPGSAPGLERGVSAGSSRGLDWWERAGTMTKQKLTPSSSFFMKAWQTCRQQRKEVAEKSKIEIEINIKRRDGRIKNVLSSKIRARAYVCPLYLFSGLHTLSRTSTALVQTQPWIWLACPYKLMWKTLCYSVSSVWECCNLATDTWTTTTPYYQTSW